MEKWRKELLGIVEKRGKKQLAECIVMYYNNSIRD